MRKMIKKQIDQSINNVMTTLAVENIKLNKLNVIEGEKFLKGEITSAEAIEHIKAHIKTRMTL